MLPLCFCKGGNKFVINIICTLARNFNSLFYLSVVRGSTLNQLFKSNLLCDEQFLSGLVEEIGLNGFG